MTDLGYNLDDDSACNLHATTDLTGVAAGLDPTGLQSNGGPTQTIALESGSAAIGRVGNPAQCPATDQRGDPRAVPCDIGAYNTGGQSVNVTVSGSQSYGGAAGFSQTDNAPSGVSLRGTLTCASVDGGTTVSTTLGVGPHTVDGSSCSGLTASNPSYHLIYTGAPNGYVVSRTPPPSGYHQRGQPGLRRRAGHPFTATVDTGNGESLPAAETVTIEWDDQLPGHPHPGCHRRPGRVPDRGHRPRRRPGPRPRRATAVTATCPARARPPPRSPSPRPPAIEVTVTGSQVYGSGGPPSPRPTTPRPG